MHGGPVGARANAVSPSTVSRSLRKQFQTAVPRLEPVAPQLGWTITDWESIDRVTVFKVAALTGS